MNCLPLTAHRLPFTIYELTNCGFLIDRHELYGKVCGELSLLHSVPLAPTSHPRSVWWGHFFDYSALEYVRVLSKPGIT